VICAKPADIIFTSGGTEADNLAVKGLARSSSRRRVLVSAVEHHAVLDPAMALVDEGFTVDLIPVDPLGRVDVADLELMLSDNDVAVVAVMWANNEVGTIQPIERIAQVCAAHGVALHTDAVQALGQLDLDVIGIGSAALSAHKIGGPVGVGALVLDRDLPVRPLVHGGGQERDVRSGTLDAAGIAGFAAALAAQKPGSHAAARCVDRGCAERGPGRCPQRRPVTSPAQQRPLQLSGVSGRRPADAPGRRRRGGVDRFCVHGRDPPAQPCPAGDGRR
jgi:cysteine desulfurase